MADGLPSYDDLLANEPSGSSWGVFGPQDEVGTLNFLTADAVVAASRSVRHGLTFPLDWDLELPDPPLFGRGRLEHTVLSIGHANDDRYDDFSPQRSSQWDALAHVAHPTEGFYNRVGSDGRARGDRLGVDRWAERGIVGRFVLLDVKRHADTYGEPIDGDSSYSVTPDLLEEVAERQGVVLASGDILLLRFGWIAWYESLDSLARQELAAAGSFNSPGLARGAGIPAWLWDHRVAAVAGDVPALEVMPFDEDDVDGFLHYALIPLLGYAVGEMFSLDRLAEHCAQVGAYDGMIVSAPLNKRGGIGSPPNAVAIV